MTENSNSHTHTHDDHEALVVEDEAGNVEAQIIIDALQTVLVARGLLTTAEVTKEIEKLESPGLQRGLGLTSKVRKLRRSEMRRFSPARFSANDNRSV